jgi:hypothetical protein
MKSGVVMGLSEALKEEVTFDKSKLTSTNWDRYKILTIEEMPRNENCPSLARRQRFRRRLGRCQCHLPSGSYRGVLRCNWVQARRIPLTPAYVVTLLKG